MMPEEVIHKEVKVGIADLLRFQMEIMQGQGIYSGFREFLLSYFLISSGNFPELLFKLIAFSYTEPGTGIIKALQLD